MNYVSKGLYARALLHRPRSFRHGVGADVIPLRRLRDGAFLAAGIGFILIAIAAWISIAAMLAIGMPSGQDIIGPLVRGWPRW